jgi:hypothetical protein
VTSARSAEDPLDRRRRVSGARLAAAAAALLAVGVGGPAVVMAVHRSAPEPSGAVAGAHAPPAASTAPSTTAATTPSPAHRPGAAPVAVRLPRVPWEGGPGYYRAFARAQASGWTDPGHFPIGVWYESVLTDADVQKDMAGGLNTYVELTDDSDIGLVRRSGMSAIVSQQSGDRGNETVGWLLGDEIDMEKGAGDGFAEMQRLRNGYPAKDGRIRYANYGKGVMLWESDADAAKFVNGYTNVTSADVYWYTDPYMCPAPGEEPPLGVTAATCRRAANYGLTMDRLRHLDALDGKRQPIYGFVEVGHPFAEGDSRSITGPEIAGAVMSSLIHEARGIVYFNHSFGGSCESQHVLRDECGAAVRPAVTEINSRITRLAPVLNTQSYAWRFSSSVDTMLKAYDGSYYLFAMPGRTGGTGHQNLTLPPGLHASSAEVLFEGRSVRITGRVLADTFAKESSYHIYKITP